MSVQAVQADSVKLFSPAILPPKGGDGMETIWKRKRYLMNWVSVVLRAF